MIFSRHNADSKERLIRFLNYLLWFIFGCLVFIWFKDNFTSFRRFQISPLIPLVLFVLIFSFKLIIRKKKKGAIRLSRPKVNKVCLAIVVLLLLATGFRIPFLIHNFGLYSSDHAVSALMAKHISEGKLPPIYYYGQLYLGSISEHFFALLFFLFGYSVFLLKLSTLLFYLAFIVVQFVLLKEIFSFDFSFFVSLFYCLPIGHLVNVSFFNTAPFSLTLLLGTLLLYFAYLITYKDRPVFVPILGFLMGLSFWTHPILIAFVLTASIFLVWKFRLHLKKYATLFVFAFLGSLPFWIHGILEGFTLVEFLVPGEKKLLIGARIQVAIDLIQELLFLKETPLNYVFLVLIFLGFCALIFFSFKKRTLAPQSLYSIFFFLFLTMYLVSDFNNAVVIRYLYPLYFCLPILLFSIFLFIKSKVKYFVIFLLFVSLFFFGNLKEQMWGYQNNRETDRMLREVITTLEKTGKRYWQGEYWSAYLISALSKEKIIVDSWAQNRYFPYRLDYYNRGENNNFIFLQGEGSYEANLAERLIYLLETFEIEYRSKKTGDSLLIYDVESTVFPPIFDLDSLVPPHLPDFDLTKIRHSDGYLNLTFKNNKPVKDLHLMAHVEIPDYSSAFKAFSWNKEEIEIKIPFPDEESFKIISYFDYRGLKIPMTEKEIFYSLPEDEDQTRRKNIVYLSGVGPLTDFEEKRLRICEKEARFEINNELNEDTRIQLYIYSPFQFNLPYWYGENSQKVKVEMNDVLLQEYKMEDGENRIDLALKDIRLKEGSNILTLRFEYHLPFVFSLRWKTAALLDRIEIH